MENSPWVLEVKQQRGVALVVLSMEMLGFSG